MSLCSVRHWYKLLMHMCYTHSCAAQCTHPCATHVRSSCIPLIQATNVSGLQTPCVLYTTDAMYERPCATHVGVLCTLLTSNPRPTTFVCWSVVWTTNTSNKSKCRVHDCYKLHTSTQFFSSFFLLHSWFAHFACILLNMCEWFK